MNVSKTMYLFSFINSTNYNNIRSLIPISRDKKCGEITKRVPLSRFPRSTPLNIMPSIKLQPHCSSQAKATATTLTPNNPLPTLLQTPSGLALLELQGTINIPSGNEEDDIDYSTSTENPASTFETPIGKLMFPDYSVHNPDDTKWMKRAYMYVGRYQRMTGEVKKLPRPIAVLQKRQESEGEELEVVDIVRYKIFFKSRPEPVTNV